MEDLDFVSVHGTHTHSHYMYNTECEITELVGYFDIILSTMYYECDWLSFCPA